MLLSGTSSKQGVQGQRGHCSDNRKPMCQLTPLASIEEAHPICLDP